MISPQECLQDYLNGINNVIDSNPPEEDLVEIVRIKNMFTASISNINLMLRKAKYTPRAKGMLESHIQVLDIRIEKIKKQLEIKKVTLKKNQNRVSSYKKTYLFPGCSSKIPA